MAEAGGGPVVAGAITNHGSAPSRPPSKGERGTLYAIVDKPAEAVAAFAAAAADYLDAVKGLLLVEY